MICLKRLLTLFLCLLLLAGCAPKTASAPPAAPEQLPTAEELACAVLDACGRSPDELERTDLLLDEAGLSAYLTNYYGLEEGSWQDCAIYRAGGADAFEIAVAQLTPNADMAAALEGMNAYIWVREGDFTGYAPEQAVIVHQSYADGAVIALADAEDALKDNTLWARFVALFICEDPTEARSAFLRCLDPEAAPAHRSPQPESPPPVTVSASPEPTSDLPSLQPSSNQPSLGIPSPDPAPSAVSSPEPSPVETSSTQAVTYPGRTDFLPPGIDDMTICDTSGILAAWESGDSSALSDRDREVYDVCRQVISETIRDEMSDYDKELAIYRWLNASASYDWDHNDRLAEMDPASYTPYGVLIRGKGVCLGFATTFQLFMDLCDVECITIVGASHQSTSDHAWNMVRLNGEWYCVDPTWDLSGRLRYFNVTSDYMAGTDHQWDYDHVPEATARDGGT